MVILRSFCAYNEADKEVCQQSTIEEGNTLKFRSRLLVLLLRVSYYMVAVFTTRRWAAVHRGEHHDLVGRTMIIVVVHFSFDQLF
jgi:hypothetical protein